MTKTAWTRKDLVGLKDLSREEITLILDTAKSLQEVSTRPVKKVPTLRGRTVANMFFEPSTRTRISFELAEKRLSADTINFSAATSSTVKGESIKDTVRNIESLKVDIIVMRHPASGAPHRLAERLDVSFINAGDGINEHPTQALLDMFTIKEKKGTLEGVKVTFIGDILHSRVARSNIWGLTKMGAKVVVCGPKTLIPPKVEELGVEVIYDLYDAIKDADVINLLRIQMERQSECFFPSIREYANTYQINRKVLEVAKKDVVIMHPGPVNRGIEVSSDVMDGPSSVILDQVTNGLAVRMAVLYLLSGARKKIEG
ncbi:MAG: aspartate carbamoyltransferase [Omnitrophica bacterium RIFCSPLOWO2_12_FULL_44_17]|uniref:Aspartate carbamoyltransferase n=1 Tax=Candidatus Danuiimicrobium aquiferis TaxID=1801832 RepID=A0A1G1KS03_9BACT|nr:MAG: aspartate carbamoyltransferase [Omnitrophica bacterium RIFCSPHIGHO2_02_FULL_45_28]OGW91879.1 MAG: aspartate carbamoyltransferase [Omnitrophica bacterium RIFCSPHIGHO2_12_FULL_44_12]OGW95595.1 MAG: aspartate carbamoyltransferase [Omnitrophica bacterium RIFCSPLOWO2_12_FULL_44_17]OGX03690.1 MAG: aspartate carbamoyltransferase [Omnitrophica bacterium RIFCSPLOWO2_02_FULL_44_11]